MGAPDFDQLSVGDQIPGATVHVERATMVRYAGASLDFNPIHYDDRFATSVGLPDVIAHGMWTMGSAIQIVVDWAGDAGRVVEYTVRFSAPVPVPYDSGTDVAVAGRVKSLDEERRRVVIDITASVGGAKVLSRALATVDLG
ncbi:MaoC family dehydratase [Leekyejoonella antrihumi]|uniref:Acyl dehydratase n=1 Tax=Leekyejoonella antrihumi TaxID=1660198 RepID=A0A563E8Y9_9MICO|nr:MaoC family dehydratase [Leekyejoonella antrihumi]TWP38915.1 acyl dehydratase [Leekyejoonella antrihumi]